ncbi:MAG: OmpA family protein [Firmicutes bacterium]|nr:OmpA family protein [Bacillota bacterium]
MFRKSCSNLVLILVVSMVLMVVGRGNAAILKVADFDSGEKPNNLGGDFGAWDKDPTDLTQTCMDSFSSEVKYGDKGYSLKLTYDVDSPNPAYNGFWTKLQNQDLRGYKELVFFVKGDEGKGFTRRFKVELKNPTQVGSFLVSGVTSEWQKVIVPLKKFKRITDWSKMTEFVIVFDDLTSNPKEGVIYIDDICFSDGKGVEETKETKEASLPDTVIISFDSGDIHISTREFPKINKMVDILKLNPEYKLRIKGYSDSVGADELNLLLSRKRAAIVLNYLVITGGIDPDRLHAVGYGEAKPITENDTWQGRALNRRVELVIIEK